MKSLQLWEVTYTEVGGTEASVFITTINDDISEAILVFRNFEKQWSGSYASTKCPLKQLIHKGIVFIYG